MAGFIISEEEIADGALSSVYQDIYVVGQNKDGDKLMIRNTTLSRLQFRFGGDDANTLTISPGEKMIIGGFSALAGNKIEVRTVTDVASSIRLSIYK